MAPEPPGFLLGQNSRIIRDIQGTLVTIRETGDTMGREGDKKWSYAPVLQMKNGR